jgi:hypothetical protein
MTVTMVDEGLPSRPALAVASAQLRQVIPAERQAQGLTKVLEPLAPVETLKQLLLGQGTIDLTHSVTVHDPLLS